MTLHLLGLPWTETTREWEPEAYTARTRVLASAVARHGRVVLYAGERDESRATEHVPVVSRAWQRRHFPDASPQGVFNQYDPASPGWVEWNVQAALAIRERAQRGDILGITMGAAQKPVADLLADLGLVVCEVGIGYGGVFAPFRVYESWAWRFFHAGRANGMAVGAGRADADLEGDVRNFDEVIPRGYEIEDFPAGDGAGGYFLYVGRIVSRKGPHIASQVCQRIGAKLIVAGPGAKEVSKGRIVAEDGTVLAGDVEYAGVVDWQERARLMGGAIATFAPTLYAEPFGGVHAEAMLTGTPAITSDWGAFHENVEDGVTGWRCRSIEEFVRAARTAPQLYRSVIRARAQARFGSEAVGHQYDRYFRRLATLRRDGWYELPPQPVAA